MNEEKPQLRIRANVSENVKGIISCDVTIEMSNGHSSFEAMEQAIAIETEKTLTKLHQALRVKGHKLATDLA